jgi:hypothetical protein
MTTEKGIRRFCKEKYGTEFPTDVGFGPIVWTNVPYFAMPYSPKFIKSVPYLENTAASREDRYWRITPDQLLLLGIDFDPYDHGPHHGKAYIQSGNERMQLTPEFGKIEEATAEEEGNFIGEIKKVDLSKYLTVDQYKEKYGKDYSEDGSIITTREDFGPDIPFHLVYWAYKRDLKAGIPYTEPLCDMED